MGERYIPPEARGEYSENIESEHIVTKEQVILAIKEDLDSPETENLVLQYEKQLQDEANSINTSIANIEVSEKMAEMFEAAGLTGNAYDCLEYAWDGANQESDCSIVARIEEQMQRLRDELENA